MYSSTDIIAKAWMVTETVNLMIAPKKVGKIFLIGSYAAKTEDEWSDLDFLIQLDVNIQPGKLYNLMGLLYPTAQQMYDINQAFKDENVHVIFGTEEAQKSMNKPYKELTGGINAYPRNAYV